MLSRSWNVSRRTNRNCMKFCLVSDMCILILNLQLVSNPLSVADQWKTNQQFVVIIFIDGRAPASEEE